MYFNFCESVFESAVTDLYECVKFVVWFCFSAFRCNEPEKAVAGGHCAHLAVPYATDR